MLSKLCLAGAALVVQAERQDVTADNLANANTAGYKRLRLGVRAVNAPDFGSQLASSLGRTGNDTVLDLTYQFDPTAGQLAPSGNPCDLALTGPGYFSVLDQGTRAYTRNGSFHLDTSQTLVDAEGRPVLGERGGPLQITGGSWSVNEDGTVLVDGAAVDKLLIADFPGSVAARGGQGLLHVPEAAVHVVTDAHVKQGYVESSNVNSIEEMVSMMSNLRAYEATQRVIMAQDQMLDKTVNDVGRT
jgi:flagellar basal-body rod protein FlgF